MKGQPDVCISHLMVTMEQSQQPDSRNLSAVLLRKASAKRHSGSESQSQALTRSMQSLTKDDPSLWTSCSPPAQVGGHMAA